MEITLGPKVSDEQKEIVEMIINKYNSNIKIKDSILKNKIN